jgi:tRNA pseudouridine55 synthase
MRKTLSEKKIGHTGTLDPLATGCLLVATGKYTKLIPYFEKDTKEYTCEILLDGVSDSFDIDTPVDYISKSNQERYKNELTREFIESILEKYFL